MKNLIAVGCALSLVGASFNANAATVIAVIGDSIGGGALGYQYGPDPFTEILAVEWTSSLSFLGVTITAQIGSNNPVGATGQAFLTTQIGSGTTVSDQVAATSFVFPATVGGSFSAPLTLFTGLNLSAGTSYFLTITPDAGFTAAWNQAAPFSISSDDPHVTTPGFFNFSYDGLYPSQGPPPDTYLPASVFKGPFINGGDLVFSVTGTIAPEPSTLAFVGIGLALFSRRHRETR